MNNEEKILALLEGLDRRISRIETDTAAAKAKLSLLQMDVSDMKAGQAELKTGQAKLQEDTTEIKENVKYIWEGVGRLTDRLNEHNTIIQKRVM